MIYSLGILVFLGSLGLGLAAFAWVTGYRFATETARLENFRWLRAWTLRGLLVPAFIWAVMNFGFSFEFQPFMPRLQIVQGTVNWLPLYCAYAATGFCVISSYWTAVTLAWIAWRAGNGLDAEIGAHFRALCLTSLGVLILPAIGMVALGGWLTLGLALTLILAPVAGYGPTVLRPKKMPPLYAKAIARMKFGKYSEAEQEVIAQLEKREDDFDGWMMLAELYANHFNDVEEAEQTILEICDQPRTTPSQMGTALHKLADWHLKLRSDPDAARRALQVIANRQPGTHLARMAQARAAQLPQTAEELREQQINKPVHLPALHDPLDEPAGPAASTLGAKEAAERVTQLNARLKHRPDDLEIREELARLYAGPLDQPSTGIAHLQSLLARPDRPEAKAPEWLGLIAAWQLERLHASAAGSETLRRLIQEFPESPTAHAAQRRLQHLEAEEKMRLARAAKPPPIRIRIDPGGTTPAA